MMLIDWTSSIDLSSQLPCEIAVKFKFKCRGQTSTSNAKVKCQGQMSRSNVKVKCQGQMSRSNVKVKCQGQTQGHTQGQTQVQTQGRMSRSNERFYSSSLKKCRNSIHQHLNFVHDFGQEFRHEKFRTRTKWKLRTQTRAYSLHRTYP